MDISNRKAFLILIILLILVFIINLSTFKNGHNWENSDFAAYLFQAKGIINGNLDEVEAINRYRYENSTLDTGNLTAPWGFPSLLSPIYYFFGLDIYAMKVYVNLFFILSLFVVFLFFQGRLNNFQNLLLVAVIAFNPWFFDFKDNVLSEYPFLFFSLLTLFLISRFIILKKIWINEFVSYSLVGLLIFISYSIRSVGLLLLATLLFVQYIEIKRSSTTVKDSLLRDKFNYAPYIVFLILVVILTWTLPTGVNTSYFKIFSNLGNKDLFYEIKYYAVLPSRFFPFLFLNMNVYGFGYNKFSIILYGMILLITIMGMMCNRKKDYMILAYVLFMIPLMLAFSKRCGFRLLIPITPFFLYFLFAGFSKFTLSMTLSEKYKSFQINAASLFACCLILISLLYISHTSYQNIIFNKTKVIGPYSADSNELFHYIKANTNKDDAVIFHKPRSMPLYTDRKSLFFSRYTFTFDDLLNSHAQYIAHHKKDSPLNLSVQELRDNFNCKFENNTYILCSLENIIAR